MIKQRILLVDDDTDILNLVSKKLCLDDFDVKAVDNGTEALVQAGKFNPDLILMDIVLPDLDGSEAVKRLKESKETSNIPIIFLSGIVTSDNDDSSKTEIKVAGGMFRAIGKPFTYAQLREEIDRILF